MISILSNLYNSICIWRFIKLISKHINMSYIKHILYAVHHCIFISKHFRHGQIHLNVNHSSCHNNPPAPSPSPPPSPHRTHSPHPQFLYSTFPPPPTVVGGAAKYKVWWSHSLCYTSTKYCTGTHQGVS